MNGSYVLKVTGVPDDEAQILTEELKEVLLDAHEEVRVERKREDPEAQDFGALLSIVLAAPAAVAVAKGIANWLMRHRGVTIRVETKDGILVADHLTTASALELVKTFKGEAG